MIRIALAAAAALLFSGAALAQQPAGPPVGPDWSKIEVKTTDLGNRTYMLEGQGGNVTVAAGDDGVIMVDGQFAPMHDKLKAAIAAVSPQPIKFLVNTHHHGDHVGGNAAFTADGAVVVAHANLRDIMAKGGTNNISMQPVPPATGAALPAKTYTDTTTVEVKGRAAQLKHTASSPTGGDTYIYFADANVLSTGDVVSLGRYPNIDYLNGGSVKGMIAAADRVLIISDDTTKIIPGHGPLSNKAELKAYRDMLVKISAKIEAMVKAKKTLAQVIAAKPTRDFDKAWGKGFLKPEQFVEIVYTSATKRN